MAHVYLRHQSISHFYIHTHRHTHGVSLCVPVSIVREVCMCSEWMSIKEPKMHKFMLSLRGLGTGSEPGQHKSYQNATLYSYRSIFRMVSCTKRLIPALGGRLLWPLARIGQKRPEWTLPIGALPQQTFGDSGTAIWRVVPRVRMVRRT